MKDEAEHADGPDGRKRPQVIGGAFGNRLGPIPKERLGNLEP
jgi:hypothetical protein